MSSFLAKVSSILTFWANISSLSSDISESSFGTVFSMSTSVVPSAALPPTLSTETASSTRPSSDRCFSFSEEMRFDETVTTFSSWFGQSELAISTSFSSVFTSIFSSRFVSSIWFKLGSGSTEATGLSANLVTFSESDFLASGVCGELGDAPDNLKCDC